MPSEASLAVSNRVHHSLFTDAMVGVPIVPRTFPWSQTADAMRRAWPRPSLLRRRHVFTNAAWGTPRLAHAGRLLHRCPWDTAFNTLIPRPHGGSFHMEPVWGTARAYDRVRREMGGMADCRRAGSASSTRAMSWENNEDRLADLGTIMRRQARLLRRSMVGVDMAEATRAHTAALSPTRAAPMSAAGLVTRLLMLGRRPA